MYTKATQSNLWVQWSKYQFSLLVFIRFFYFLLWEFGDTSRQLSCLLFAGKFIDIETGQISCWLLLQEVHWKSTNVTIWLVITKHSMEISLDRAVFKVSKVIRNCFGFALLCSVIGLENSRHLLNQSEVKPKPIASLATWSHAFSRACMPAGYVYLHRVLIGSLRCFRSVVIDHCNCCLVLRHSI